MGWRDRLRPATFRGVQFSVLTVESEFGRRQVTHQAALVDVPFSEDLGRAADAFQVEGYIVGEDYDQIRDDLIKAIRDTAGPGRLVHPYQGEKSVIASGFRIREDSAEQRMCRFTVSFGEAGDLSQPTDSIDAPNALAARAGAISDASTDSFSDLFSVESFPQFVRESAKSVLGQLGDYLSTPTAFLTGAYSTASDVVGGVTGAFSSISSVFSDINGFIGDTLSFLPDEVSDYQALVSDFMDSLDDLIDFPSDIFSSGSSSSGGTLISSGTSRSVLNGGGTALDRALASTTLPTTMSGAVLKLVGGVRQTFGSSSGNILSGLLSVLPRTDVSTGGSGTSTGGSGTPATPAVVLTPSRAQVVTNTAALTDFIRQTATAQLAIVAVSQQYETVDSAVAVRDAVAEVIDQEAEAAKADPVYNELTQARAELIKALPAADQSPARVVPYVPAATLPALVIAQTLYDDASRADQIVSRNRPRHPGFISGGQPLQVLSDV